jgi:hypothetical protein
MLVQPMEDRQLLKPRVGLGITWFFSPERELRPLQTLA